MSTRARARGLSLLEVIIVAAILGLIAVISFASMRNLSNSSNLRQASGEVYDALREARARTLSAENETVYGVHLATSSVTRFSGPTYTPGAAGNRVTDFSSGISATSSLIGGGGTVLFRRLTGESTASGTIFIRNGQSTTSIVLYGSGLIEHE